MGAGPSFVFLPFRLDLTNECLWCGQERRALRSKTFAVFRQLLEQPGQLVTKEALLETIWPDAYVSDAALTVCIGEIRQALGDDPKTPRFIETVHRRGYRFIGDLSQPPSPKGPTSQPPSSVRTTQYAKSGDLHIAYQVAGEGRSTWCSCRAGCHMWNMLGSNPCMRSFSIGLPRSAA